MGKFDGVLLVTDYDDTLYSQRLEVSAGNRAAISYFMEQGGRFTVATGRAFETFTPQMSRERFSVNAPVVLLNGAALYDYESGSYLHRSHLSGAAMLHLLQLLTILPQLGVEAYHEHGLSVYNPNEATRVHLERVNVPYTLCERAADLEMPWFKLLLEQEHSVLEQAQTILTERWGELYEVIFSNHFLLEITAKGSSKGAMVERLRTLLNIRPEDTYCIGDNQNDLSMLDVSAIPFAPANCVPQLRERSGTRLVRHCNEDALAEVVEILDGRY